MPVRCVWGSLFSPDHALICPFGGYPTIRHNEIRDLLGVLLSDVCHNVAVEQRLTPQSGEVFCHRSSSTSPEARLDVRACGFWTRHEDAFFDVRVFHPNAESYRTSTLEELFRRHERHKQLQFEERVINMEHGSFCPLVFSTTGTAGPLCDRFLKRLASLLTRKTPAVTPPPCVGSDAESLSLSSGAVSCAFEAQGPGKASPFTKELTIVSLRAAFQLLHSEPSHAICTLLLLFHSLADKLSKVHICLSLLSCQLLSAACMHIFSFTYTFLWHMHAHVHCRTCLHHTCAHT